MNYKIINVILSTNEYNLVKYLILVKINPIPKNPGSEGIWTWEYQFYCLKGNIKKIISPLIFDKLSKMAISYKKLGYNSELDNEQLLWVIRTNIFNTINHNTINLGKYKYAFIYNYGCIDIKK